MATANPYASRLTFRRATGEDVAGLGELAGRIWRVSYAEMISAAQIEYMLGWMYAPERIRDELAAGILWELALLDGSSVGFLAVSFEQEARAELHKLYLLPEHQGRGLGQAMLQRVFSLANERRLTSVRLRVNKQNGRALRAYGRAGFHIIESIVGEIGGGFVMDDYVLQRALPSSADGQPPQS